MVERIEVRELRQHASRYLARVKAGETVERLVTDGRLTPATLPVRFPVRVRAAVPTESMLDESREDR